MTPRESAYLTLLRVLDDGAWSNLVLTDASAFERRLVKGCLERKRSLDFIISRYTKTAPDTRTAALLLTGVYQILFMDVPDSAACDESVKLAKKYLGERRGGFVNAVLRSLCRDRLGAEKALDTAADGIKFSLSDGICTLIKNAYPQEATEIFSSYFGERHLYLRVNNQRATAEEVAKAVGGSVLSSRTVLCGDAPAALAGLNTGNYFFQGIGSQRTVELLGIEPGMTVADVCACPGGKSFGAAIDLCDKGKLFAFDVRKNKLPLIISGAKRLGLDNITVSHADSRTVRSELAGRCDRVICDVPCSGLGEIASKPEIRYKSPDTYSGLYPTQRAILSSASELLKAGGKMTYSTCTINPLENEDAVCDFIRKNSGFSLLSSQTLLPCGEGKGEGFYIALLQKEHE